MQRTIFLAITLLALATNYSWGQAPAAQPAVTPPAPPAAEKAESPPPVVDDAAVEAKLVDSELLKREMLKLVGRWKLISASEQNIKLDDSDGMEIRLQGDKLEATISQRGANKLFNVMLTVSDTPGRVRRIQFVEKQFNDVPQTISAVYEISGIYGENEKPLRLKMNLSKREKYPASMDERGEGIHQLEFEHVVPREGALGIPASAIPGKVWITSGTAIVAIADDGKSAAAYCEKHPTWVSIQLDPTITAQPTPVAGVFDVAVQHGPQCHAYSMSLGTWATLTLPAGEEAVANLGSFHGGVSVHSKTQGEYAFKNEWGKWFSAEEIKAGKVVEHLAALKAKSGETAAPSANVTKVFSLKHAQATAATELLKQLYDPGPAKIAMDARTNSVIVSGPIVLLAEIDTLLLKLDAGEPVATAATATPISIEAAKQIAQLEDERVILLQDMGDQHPKVLELDARLAQARSRLVESAPSTPNNLLRRDSTVSNAGDAIYRKELLMLDYLQDTLSELKKERDEIIQKEGEDHPDVARLQASVAEEETKVQKHLAQGKVASEQVIAEIEETVGEMKQFLERLPKGVEGMREERNNLVKYDPKNPRIRELDKGIAALKAMGRFYFDLVAAIEAGQVTPFLPAIVPLTNAVEVSASYSKQISQLRKDYEAAEAEVQRLAAPLRRPGVTASLDELAETVERSFKLRQSLLRAELSEMQGRLARTQHSIDLRDRIIDQIVFRRVEELLNPQLKWDRDSNGDTKGDLSHSKPGEAQTPSVTQTIPAGMRVVTIDVDLTQHSPVPSRVHAGDRVDVLVSGDAGPDILLEFVTVFDVTSVTSGENAEAANQQHVSLLVTPEMAKAVFLAQKRKQVSLSLRSQQDVATSKLNAAAYEKLMTRGEFHAAMLAKLQGTWEAVFSAPGESEDKSKTVTRNIECIVEIRNDTLRFSGITNKALVHMGDIDLKIRAFGQTQPGMPQGVELTFGSIKEGSPDECPGIIEILDDQVRLCFGETERPTAFEVGNAHATWLLTLRRPSQESRTATSKSDLTSSPIGVASQADLLTKLQGHWQLMQHTYEPVDTSDGKKPQPGDVKRENWNPETYYRKQTIPWKAMFDGHQMSICKEDGSDPMTFELSFRKAGPPQQVDLTLVLNEEQIAEFKRNTEESQSPMEIPAFISIIEETPDGFRMCLDLKATGTRPFLFVLGPDTGLWEFRRSPIQPEQQAADREILPTAEGKSPLKNLNPTEAKGDNPNQLTAQQMTSLFNAILQRPPYEGEAEAWLSAVQKGQSTTDVTSTLLASNEVFDRLGRDKAAFVSYLHKTFLDRKPTEDELMHWTLRYAALQGIRSAVAEEFIDSVGASTVVDLLNRRAASQKTATDTENDPPQRASLQIPKGMRLNTFPVTDSQTNSGLLKPGDRVDVKVMFTNRKELQEIKTLLEYVQVFACEATTLKDEDGDNVERGRFVTLLVNPEQDGYLEIAKTKGQLSLALRNPDDDELVNRHGLNTAVLNELKHAIKPDDASAVTLTELEGDWNLVWMETRDGRSRSPINMTIRGNRSVITRQKDETTVDITVNAKEKSILFASQIERPAQEEQAPPIPSGSRGTYDIVGDRLTIHSKQDRQTYVWTRGLRDLQTARQIPEGMKSFGIGGNAAATGQGQLFPGDKVDITAEWRKFDGTSMKGIVAERVEVEYTAISPGDPFRRPRHYVAVLVSAEQEQLLRNMHLRNILSVSIRKPGDDSLQYPNGVNTSVITEIKVAAGANPVTPLEGDWYLYSDESGGNVTGQRMNLSIRGDEWTRESILPKYKNVTEKLQGRLFVDSEKHSFSLSKWPEERRESDTNIASEFQRGASGSYEIDGDTLKMKCRDSNETNFTMTWKRGLRQVVLPLSPASDSQRLRWRSGVVEIFQVAKDSLDKVRRGGVFAPTGQGAVVSPDGLIVAHVVNSTLYLDNPDSYPLYAKFDDGSLVKLTPVEDAKNGWLALKPEKEIRVNHFFPIATTPNAIADEVYGWGTNISGGEHFLDVFQSKILLMDRRISGTSEPVWQLLKPDHWGRASGLPILSAEGELLAITMPDTGDLLLALPADRLKTMFPKSFSPPAAASSIPPATEEKPAPTP